MTELISAISLRNLPKVKTLIAQGADVNDDGDTGIPPLFIAIMWGINFVKVLVESGADINVQIEEGITPLHQAMYRNDNLEIVEYLVSRGADLNVQTEQGLTPLHRAVRMNHFEIVKYLISQGARMDIPDNNGVTLMESVERSKDPRIREYFQKLLEARRTKFYVDRYVIGKQQVPGGGIPELPDDVLRKISGMAGTLSFGKTVNSEIRYLRTF
jgi:ankyrin repeat protein